MLGDRFGGHRLEIEPALDLVAASGADHCGLFAGFDAFCGHIHLHRARDRDRGQHHRAASVIGIGLGDEAAIDLELFEAEAAQEPDRGVAGAEIVQHHADAEAPDHRQAAFGDHRIDDETVLGDLQLQPFGREAGFFEDMTQLDRKFRVLQLDRRQVDRKLDPIPVERIDAGTAQRPETEGIDQTGLFGDGYEATGLDPFAIGPVPAQQRLYPDDPLGVAIDQGLVVQLELLAREGAAQFLFHHPRFLARDVGLDIEPAAASLSAALRFEQGDVGATQQFGTGMIAVRTHARQTNACPDGETHSIDMNRLRHPVDDLAGHALDQGRGQRTSLHQSEFVTTQAIDPCLFAAQLAEDSGGCAKQLVADGMAVAVVYTQKPVEIDEGEGDLFRSAGIGRDGRIVGMQPCAVGKAGQRIAQREAFELAGVPQRQRSEGDQDQGLDDPAAHEDPSGHARSGRKRSRNGIGEGDRDRQ